MMRHIVCDAFGGPEVMRLADAPCPQPGPGEVLVEVAFAGINRPDVLQRRGMYPPPPGASPVLGLEVAGQVLAVGEGVSSLRRGDLVCALVNGGGYAEYALAHESQCLPVPAGWSLREAACLPEVAFTVWHNVFERGQLLAGESLLVHGGAGGIGSFAVGLASARGARVFATGGGAVKCEAIMGFGAERAIDYQVEDFVEVCQSLTGGRGVDVVLDMVGGDYLQRNLRVCATEGRVVSIAFLRGSRAELDLMPLMMKRITWTGSTLRAQSLEAKAGIARAVLREVWPLLAAGGLKPHIHGVFPLDAVAEAHAQMERSEHIGKLVLSLR